VATPDDNKIDFDKLSLSGDLSDSLEPIAENPPEIPIPEQEPEAEAKIEQLPADVEKAADQVETVSDEFKAVPSESKYKVWLQKLATADPYTVLLGITVAALLIAVLCCLIELGRYRFDIGAKGAKQPLTMATPVSSIDSIRNVS
jgi:hypothetical protein